MIVHEDRIEALVQAAVEARLRAYAPYSRFQVGAAILDCQGQIFTGCNVENASYSLCLCAERTAGGHAVASGSKNWLAIAIATAGGVAPCGACRQFLVEFGSDLEVISVAIDQAKRRRWKLKELLPDRFDQQNLPLS